VSLGDRAYELIRERAELFLRLNESVHPEIPAISEDETLMDVFEIGVAHSMQATIEILSELGLFQSQDD